MTGTALDAILHAIPVPAMAIDASERIICANAEARALFGQNAVGTHYITILRQPVLLEAIEASLLDGTSRETKYLGNDGAQDTTYKVSVRAAPGAKPDGRPAAIVSFEDTTHLEEATQMRRDFVGNVSHELRTPLTSIMGFIETLRGPAREDRAAADRFLDIMQVEAERMNRLVGDLMSLNRVESNERVRPTDIVVLNDVLDSTLRTLKPLASDASVVLEPAFDDAPVRLYADADQLKQVFTNLVENAIKYGGSGGRVTLRTTLSRREPALRAPGVRVEVIDYGPGIDPVHLPRLTERFYRSDDHRSRALGGTGLGLAIVKHIINRHRGRLRVQSDVGQGACFTVILPIVADGAREK